MNEFYAYAKHYHSLGYNVTCINNYLTEYNFYNKNLLKCPSHKWKHLSEKRQEESEFKGYDWENAVGVGTLTDYDGLTVLDIDGCNDHSFLQQVLDVLKLPRNYEWVIQSGSKNGYHIYFYPTNLERSADEWLASKDGTTREILHPAAVAFKPNVLFRNVFFKMEILLKTHVVLPPSFHASGYEYGFINCEFPKERPREIWAREVDSLLIKFLDYPEKEILQGYGELFGKNMSFSIPSNNDDLDWNVLKSAKLFLVLDIETNGLIIGDKMPSLLQVAWVIVDRSGIVYKKEFYSIKVGEHIHNTAEHINRINIKSINIVGQDEENVIKKLMIDLQYVDTIVCHNVEFDLTIIENAMFRLFGFSVLKEKVRLCTMKSSTIFCNLMGTHGLRFPSLGELYFKLFNHSILLTHNAAHDTMVTTKCLKELIDRKIIHI